ncbi:MAG: tetratricopeptide repeat protein [bacterium]
MSELFICPGCGAEGDINAEQCEFCGNPFAPRLGSGGGQDEADLMKKLPELEAKAAKKPKDGQRQYNLGEVYHQLGNYTKAQECLEKATQLSPGLAEGFYLLAWNAGIKHGWMNTVVGENAKKAAALNPKFKQAQALVHLSAGVKHYYYDKSKQGEQSALKEFQKALQLDPDNTYAYFYAGCVCELSGDIKRAIDFFQRAAARSRHDSAPGKEDAKIFARVGHLYYRLGDMAAAKKHLTEAAKLDSNNTAVRDILQSIR